MQSAVEIFAAIMFAGIGLSHAAQPMVWVEFFAILHAKGRSGVFVEAYACLCFGAFIVAFHPIWRGLPAVLTVVGALQIVKGILRLTLPELGLRVYAQVRAERAWTFRVAGVFSMALGALFGYLAQRSWLGPPGVGAN